MAVLRKIWLTALGMLLVLLAVMGLALLMGSADKGIGPFFRALVNSGEADPLLHTIIWEIRFPRVMVAALVGATLSLGGLVFQALLRNPLAEPYILGISGGSAIGAIVGILMGLSRFPGVSLLAFLGGMGTLFLVLFITTDRKSTRLNSSHYS